MVRSFVDESAPNRSHSTIFAVHDLPWVPIISRHLPSTDLRRIVEHSLFWIAVLVFYTVYFGAREDEYGQSLFFVALLLPVTIVTTYAIVYWLVPRFLLTGQVARFVLYLLYSILLSLHLELSIVVGLYVFVSDYQAMFMSPNIIDVLDVLIGMYLVVFAALSLHTARKWQSASAQKLILQEALEERGPDPEATITLRVDRQQIPIRLVDIRYVESQRDYLLVHTRGGRLLTKQTLSSLQSELQDHGFLRIHRSFLIRTKSVTAWSAEQVSIGSDDLPIGRSYRTDVRRSLELS